MQNLRLMSTKQDAVPNSPYLVFFIRRKYLVQDTLRHIDDIQRNYKDSKEQFQKQLKVLLLLICFLNALNLVFTCRQIAYSSEISATRKICSIIKKN